MCAALNTNYILIFRIFGLWFLVCAYLSYFRYVGQIFENPIATVVLSVLGVCDIIPFKGKREPIGTQIIRASGACN